MASAMKVFEASKEKSGGFNMFACRSIIDVCGLCGDFLNSRRIFEVLFLRLSCTTDNDVNIFSSEFGSLGLWVGPGLYM